MGSSHRKHRPGLNHSSKEVNSRKAQLHRVRFYHAAANQCGCFQGAVAPAGFDCTQLVNSVTGANKSSLTFMVPPNGLEVLALRTCSLLFMNLQDEALDFCWDSLKSIGQQAFNQRVIDESDRVVGGTCNPTNGQYRVTLGPNVAQAVLRVV
ncbi:hypothetical protein ACEPAF_1291 [Sanghuangporus sanghuang]